MGDEMGDGGWWMDGQIDPFVILCSLSFMASLQIRHRSMRLLVVNVHSLRKLQTIAESVSAIEPHACCPCVLAARPSLAPHGESRSFERRFVLTSACLIHTDKDSSINRKLY